MKNNTLIFLLILYLYSCESGDKKIASKVEPIKWTNKDSIYVEENMQLFIFDYFPNRNPCISDSSYQVSVAMAIYVPTQDTIRVLSACKYDERIPKSMGTIARYLSSQKKNEPSKTIFVPSESAKYTGDYKTIFGDLKPVTDD